MEQKSHREQVDQMLKDAGLEIAPLNKDAKAGAYNLRLVQDFPMEQHAAGGLMFGRSPIYQKVELTKEQHSDVLNDPYIEIGSDADVKDQIKNHPTKAQQIEKENPSAIAPEDLPGEAPIPPTYTGGVSRRYSDDPADYKDPLIEAPVESSVLEDIPTDAELQKMSRAKLISVGENLGMKNVDEIGTKADIVDAIVNSQNKIEGSVPAEDIVATPPTNAPAREDDSTNHTPPVEPEDEDDKEQ